MARSIRIALTTLALLWGAPGMAAELSPWMGSADQTPFQLDPTTMVAVTFAADPLSTGSLTRASCKGDGCVSLVDPAKSQTATGGAPQK